MFGADPDAYVGIAKIHLTHKYRAKVRISVGYIGE